MDLTIQFHAKSQQLQSSSCKIDGQINFSADLHSVPVKMGYCCNKKVDTISPQIIKTQKFQKPYFQNYKGSFMECQVQPIRSDLPQFGLICLC